jgi:hypothetical protein
MRHLAVILALVAGCGADAMEDTADYDGTNDGGGKADGTQPVGVTYPLQIAHGAFPASGSRPNVLVYVPDGFDQTTPLHVVVFLHGWVNCVENVVGTTNQPCTAGGPARNAYHLAAQLESSQRNAILVVPELRYDQSSSDPGALGDAGVFASLIEDTFAGLPTSLALTAGAIDKLVIASHSGGYNAAASIVTQGGLPVDELWLLDSLYGQLDRFDSWVDNARALGELGASPFTMRFASIYSTSAGTLANNVDMAERATRWLGGNLLDDRTTATLTADDYAAHGAVFKHSGLAHDDIPRYYFGKLLASSLLGTKPAKSE